MRIIALILSFFIFHQSLDVCAHDLKQVPAKDIQTVPSSTISNYEHKNDCCSALKQHDQHNSDKEDNHKHCNGDFCKCMTCIKVYLSDSRVRFELNFKSSFLNEDINQTVFYHSYDFYTKLVHPPKF
ncbi:MAG TPA: hypothetical protein PK047_02240 [Saprospiraceae bacterium]|jgi:hypothetical protein|nr:hypothetical protein [Saprospiraceae bacterium]HRO07656.1 hypothetical protein [Saprospiraceae bacterium]